MRTDPAEWPDGPLILARSEQQSNLRLRRCDDRYPIPLAAVLYHPSRNALLKPPFNAIAYI